MAPKSNLATRDAADISIGDELLDLFGDAAGEGLENVTSDEIVLPRLAIIQPTSPMVTEGTARPGDIANLLNGDNYGNRVKIFPLMFWASRIYWSSKDLNSTILCSAKDGRNGTLKTAETAYGICAQCPHSQWHEGEAPICTEFKNLLVVPVSFDEEDVEGVVANTAPTVFSAKRTSIVAVNRFLSAAMAVRLKGNKVPLFASSWTLSTEKKTNDSGTYFVPVFSRIGYVESKGLFGYLRKTYQEAKDSQDKFVVSQDEHVEGSTDTSFIDSDEVDF
jgi:hypothetical protein